ncbi:MAG: efflux RND transporter periplasmic adaptor subunit [Fretibacterium sp.]|nr:efflux RND transporter periplasmic adaptor subunit [Fretibacterium sp.]
MMKKLLNVIVLAAMVAGAYYGLEFFRKQKVEEVRPEIIRPVKTVTLSGNGGEGVWRYYGTLQGGKRVELSFRVSGPIKQILVDKGASVKKGDLLATLDPRDFQTQLKQAQSNQAQAQAQYNDAQTNFKRYENLYKQRAVSKSQYDTQKTQVDVARSALNAAAAQTAAIRDSLKDTELRAPFDGVIADRMVENFQDVTAKQPIFSLQDISTLEVVFNVPDNDVIWASQAHAAREGSPTEQYGTGEGQDNPSKQFTIQARFDAIPDRAFPLTPKEFVLQADPNTNTFPVTATMPQQKDIAFLPGMTATVEVIAKDAKTEGSSYLVPATALLNEGENNFVWLCGPAPGGPNSEVHRVPVTPGLPRNDGSLEISGAQLHSGQRVVVAGAHLLREGQKVRLMENAR